MLTYQQRARIVARKMGRWLCQNQEGWEMDRLVDGGEWSGPSQGRMEDQHRRELCTRWKVTVLAAQEAEYEIAYEETDFAEDDWEAWNEDSIRALNHHRDTPHFDM